jgi:hypothetical protein
MAGGVCKCGASPGDKRGFNSHMYSTTDITAKISAVTGRDDNDCDAAR